MWGQAGWAMPCPAVPALLLLVLGTGVWAQNTCNFTADGALQAPVLVLCNPRPQAGEVALAQCVLQRLVPATRIVFCKDGVEVYSVKAQQSMDTYPMLLNISARSSGTYACGYQYRNERNFLRTSALSAPRDLKVTDPHTQPDPIVIAVVSVAVILLLSAAAYWTIKRGACGERCSSVGGAEDSFADHASFYVNVDEMRGVKASGLSSTEDYS